MDDFVLFSVGMKYCELSLLKIYVAWNQLIKLILGGVSGICQIRTLGDKRLNHTEGFVNPITTHSSLAVLSLLSRKGEMFPACIYGSCFAAWGCGGCFPGSGVTVVMLLTSPFFLWWLFVAPWGALSTGGRGGHLMGCVEAEFSWQAQTLELSFPELSFAGLTCADLGLCCCCRGSFSLHASPLSFLPPLLCWSLHSWSICCVGKLV